MISRPGLGIASLALLALLGFKTAAQRRTLGDVVEKTEWAVVWSVPVANVRAMATGPSGLVLIGETTVTRVGADGVVAKQKSRAPIAMGTSGDLDGDGTDEVVLAGPGPQPRLEALDASFEPVWSVALTGAGEATRLLVADLDGDGRREVVVGDAQGRLHVLTGTGQPVWSGATASAAGEDAAVRGLDDLRTGKGAKARRVAFALRGGVLGVVDGKGKLLWTASGDKVRRLRTIDLDGDGASEVLTGHEQGGLTIRSAEGRTVSATTFGDAVTELRAVEVDGDPARPEVAAGSKKGGVRVLRGGGAVWTASVPGKVSALGGVDLDGDGRDEVFVGIEEGGVFAFGPNGRPLGSEATGGKVEAIVGVASPLRDRLAVVAAGPAVRAYRIARKRAPAWYRPETGAGVGGLLVIAAALALLRLRPRPTDPPIAAPDGRTLRRQSLQEASARIGFLMASGHVSRDQAADRLRQLQRQLGAARPASPSPSSPPPPPKRDRE
jgi:hypothetical protein